jgi:phage terminase large subunit
MKGKNSVKNGIDKIKRHSLYITKDSDDLLREIKFYKWKEDKDGNVLDEPVKFNDHLMDALATGRETLTT